MGSTEENKTAPFWITCRVDACLEQEVRDYVEARQRAGKEPLEADVMTIIQRHTHFTEPRPAKR